MVVFAAVVHDQRGVTGWGVGWGGVGGVRPRIPFPRPGADLAGPRVPHTSADALVKNGGGPKTLENPEKPLHRDEPRTAEDPGASMAEPRG